MNVQRGTQTFSTAEQTSSQRPEEGRHVGSLDNEKALGSKNVGEALNKVADPNWIDPSKKIRSVGSNQMGKDAFMQLMMAQMKNQDPTKPMESHEMAAQLAQFTSLEQLSNINTTLEQMKEQTSPRSSFAALALIGKRVSGDSAKVTRIAGDTKHGFNFTLLGDAQKVSVKVKDAKGDVMRTLDMGSLKKGSNSLAWDGLKEDGSPTRPGEYHMVVEAKASNGAKIYAKTEFGGKITGLNYTAEGPVLLVGEQTVRLSDVKKIVDDTVENQTPAAAGSALPAMAPGMLPGTNVPMSAPPATPLGAQAAVSPTAVPPMSPQGASAPLLEKLGKPTNASPLADLTKAANSASSKSDDMIPPAPIVDPSDDGNLAQVNMSADFGKRLSKEM